LALKRRTADESRFKLRGTPEKESRSPQCEGAEQKIARRGFARKRQAKDGKERGYSGFKFYGRLESI